jgi:predicted dehydrogenase
MGRESDGAGDERRAMKILMVGLGGIGQRHTRNLRALLGESAEIIAYRVRRQTHVVTPTMGADITRNVEDVYSIRSYSTLQEALTEKPDIAFICNPSNLHVPIALDCIRAGCDVFIEKPLSNSLDGTGELVRVADERKCVVMVGYQLRFHPCLRKLAEIVHSGTLGNLLSVRATIGEYLPNWHPYEDYRQMYAARADLGGGVVLSQIHEFDYLYSLFGLPRVLYALGGKWSDLEIDVEDTASILMEFAIEGRQLPVHLHQDYLQSPPSRQCEVIGDRGRIVMDLHALTVTVYARGQATPEVHSFAGFDRNQLFLDQTKHFLDCVKTRQSPVVDLKGGLQSLRMALAAKQSLLTRQPVELESVREG